MKRALTLFLLVVLLVVACGPSDAPASTPVAGDSDQQEDLIVTVFRAPT